MVTAWSCQGLIAHYRADKNRNFIALIDQTVSVGDPFYRQLLGLKETNAELVSLHWNSTGSHLLAISKTGTIEIFRQAAGLINQYESVYFLKREEEKTPISLIWLENRRTFSFNSNYTGNTPNLPTNNTSGSGPFVTKAFHLNFIPSGRQSFLLISADNSIEVFIQNSQNFSVDFDIFKLKVENLTGILSGSFAYQRPNGTVLIVLKSEALWSVLRLSEDFELEEIYRQAEKPSGKFIWSESKEILIKLELENCGKSLKVSNYNFSTVTAKSIDLPFAMEKAEEIFHSSRASNYLFLQSKSKNVLLLNLSGESVKQLCLEADLMNFDTENLSDSLSDHLDSSLVISPNGLVIAKLSYSFDDNFPIIIYSPIGEISLKNMTMMREFLGKLISSTLNGSDSWDIFQLIRRSLQKSEESAFVFVSTILAEWISLLELSTIPARDFYGKLLGLFKILPAEFIDAYNVLDLILRFLSVERILLSCCSTNQTEFEEYFDGNGAKWPGESEQQSITIEFENLVSIIPVLEEGLLLIQELVTSYTDPNEDVFVFSLLPLENEVFRAIGMILTTFKVAQKLLKQKQNQNQQVNPKVAQFYEQALIQNSDQETFTNFLLSLRSDPQIQSKCTKNVFLFLIEFFLDPTNMKKVHGNVLRIFSRYKSDQKIHEKQMEFSADHFFDSIKCLNLPLNKTILWCRKCHRCSTATVTKSKRELIFSATWHQSLWKSRCQCGSARRIINL